MTINLTQLLLNGISTGVGAAFGTLSTFFVMRYLPKFWDKIEDVIKNGVKKSSEVKD